MKWLCNRWQRSARVTTFKATCCDIYIFIGGGSAQMPKGGCHSVIAQPARHTAPLAAERRPATTEWFTSILLIPETILTLTYCHLINWMHGSCLALNSDIYSSIPHAQHTPHARMHAHTRARTHARTHAHTQTTRTHRHTHKHDRVMVMLFWYIVFRQLITKVTVSWACCFVFHCSRPDTCLKTLISKIAALIGRQHEGIL